MHHAPSPVPQKNKACAHGTGQNEQGDVGTGRTRLLPWLERDGADLADVARVRLPREVRHVHSAKGHRDPSFHAAARGGAPRGGGAG